MADDLRNRASSNAIGLEVLPETAHISPIPPVKRINDGDDLSFFLSSQAYADIMTFLLQLNRSMIPIQLSRDTDQSVAWPLGSPEVHFSSSVTRLRGLLDALKALMQDAPPEQGPRRFGNVAFRKWYSLAQQAMRNLLKDALSSAVWQHVAGDAERDELEKELETYLLGSFGSSERLDYGTGHELSFLAFVGCIWKLGGFADSTSGEEERAIVLGIVQPYLELVRHLILTYTLEPAGSHGVWGLDDHSFLPYIFGSAQYCPAVLAGSNVPTEGSLSSAPAPGKIAERAFVERYRQSNLYFSAIGFIFDVKSGPFWEHSPTLYDISGIKDGWAKINKGMIKMYNAEVLSKFPVVQHFMFGSLFRWELDANAAVPQESVHMKAQPPQAKTTVASKAAPQATTRAPWAGATPDPLPTGTSAPWSNTTTSQRQKSSNMGSTPLLGSRR